MSFSEYNNLADPIFLTNAEFIAEMSKYFTYQDFDSFMPLQSNLFLNLF
jgi:hypothetical protein